MNLSELTSKVLAFRDVRDWKQFHKPNHLAAAIAIEDAELQEHFLWKSADEVEAKIAVPKEKEAVAEELADVLIFSLLLPSRQTSQSK
jgi:NTP pyrophosphatase (non-canonical NTP hydrolase)